MDPGTVTLLAAGIALAGALLGARLSSRAAEHERHEHAFIRVRDAATALQRGLHTTIRRDAAIDDAHDLPDPGGLQTAINAALFHVATITTTRSLARLQAALDQFSEQARAVLDASHRITILSEQADQPLGDSTPEVQRYRAAIIDACGASNDVAQPATRSCTPPGSSFARPASGSSSPDDPPNAPVVGAAASRATRLATHR